MPFSEMKDIFASLTGKPKQTLGREGAYIYLYNRVNQEALSRLTPKEQEDDSTVIAMERRIASNPELMSKFTLEFQQKYPNARTTSPMGNVKTGAPAGNRTDSSSVLKKLASQRNG
jgi:hypothetical protein